MFAVGHGAHSASACLLSSHFTTGHALLSRALYCIYPLWVGIAVIVLASFSIWCFLPLLTPMLILGLITFTTCL